MAPTSNPDGSRSIATDGRRRRSPEKTRQALCEAAIACVIRDGYCSTTVAAICAEAGLSVGAFRHHFASKVEVFVGSIDHLTARRERDLRWAAAQLEGADDDASAVVGLLWEGFRSDLFLAAVELWSAARTDPVLWAPLRQAERALARRNRAMVAELVGGRGYPNLDLALRQLMFSMRGAAMARILQAGAESEHEPEMLETWRDLFETLASGEPS